MKSLLPTSDLVLLGRRRRFIPGRVAVWAFLAGFYEVWPINSIIWERSGK